MKKIIRISESQLLNLASKKKTLMEMEMSSTYREHWENKFEKSVTILLKLGHTPDELTKKIDLITNKSNKVGYDTIYDR